MPKLPLTPMMVQYLVGLCCLKSDPDAVDVTVGDMVYDPAAEKERDVDVTVTITEAGEITHAFKAYEVKREGTPLDVAEVEQLCMKFIDMPSVTHRSIVSASGYTAPARKKAEKHGITLYEFKTWTKPLQEQFPALTMQGTAQECFEMSTTLLCWSQYQLRILAPQATGEFTVLPTDRILDSSGNDHSAYSTFEQYQNELLLRSTKLLLTLVPAATIMESLPSQNISTIAASPEWPHSHTLDVISDDVFIEIESGIFRIDSVTISGHLRWQRSTGQALYYVIDHVPSGEAFAASVISSPQGDGTMTALVFSPITREIDIRFIRLEKKHQNSIRNLKLKLSE
uniref:Restriction endonuclease type IV Mrr domain-containing protein n=1 Tax=Pseudomonas viridiflava TaxID=33069 RepID=I6LCI0_PSEVI|nr:hypothetical protein [Pseudomonas viridiflava]